MQYITIKGKNYDVSRYRIRGTTGRLLGQFLHAITQDASVDLQKVFFVCRVPIEDEVANYLLEHEKVYFTVGEAEDRLYYFPIDRKNGVVQKQNAIPAHPLDNVVAYILK